MKGVNRLELVVNQRKSHERGEITARMDELLQAAHRTVDLVRRGRDERRVLESRRRPDVDLKPPEIAGSGFAASHSTQQHCVKFANEPSTDRNLVDPPQPSLERDDVVAHLARVDYVRFAGGFQIEEE